MMQSKKLSRFSSIFHGFTTREEGDMRKLKTSQNLKMFLANQVHGNTIAMVGEKDKSEVVKKTDGLLTSTPGVFLGIRTADCLPILFYEPKAKIVAAVHAGWKGTLAKITSKMVERIKSSGGNAKNIIVAIGPHICGFCYNIPEERVRLFDKKVIYKKDGKSHLDLGLANVGQLISVGIDEQNIEILPYCTVCQNNLFFSYRKNKGTNYGEMLTIIGLLQ